MLISTSTPSYSTASLLSSQVSSDPDRRLKISPFCLSRSNDFAELDRAGSMPRPAAAVPAPRLSTNLNSYTVSRFVIEPPQPLTDLALVTQVSVATPSLFFHQFHVCSSQSILSSRSIVWGGSNAHRIIENSTHKVRQELLLKSLDDGVRSTNHGN